MPEQQLRRYLLRPNAPIVRRLLLTAGGMKEVDGKPKNCGPVAHRLRESIASPIAAIL
jgi:hypothetical protein